MSSAKRSIAIGLAALAMFVWIAWLISQGAAFSFDDMVRQYVHRSASPFLTALMLGLTYAGTDVFMGALSALSIWWMIRLGRKRDATIFTITILAAEALTQIFKYTFNRPRPEPFFGLALPDTWSFPSGHALKSAVVYVLLAVIATRRLSLRIAATLLAGLIGLSRIYLGVHYPTDVIGGFAVAAICLAGASLAKNAGMAK